MKPVWPAVRGVASAPMYQCWYSSKPSPCSSPGKAVLKSVNISSTDSGRRMRARP